MGKALSVLLVEDRPGGSESLANHIAGVEELRLAGVTCDEAAAISLLRGRQPDVLLIDKELTLGDSGGLSLLRTWRASAMPMRPWILVTTETEEGLLQDLAYDYGASLILCKKNKAYSVSFVMDYLTIMKDTIQRRSTVQPKESPEERQRRLTARICAELDRVGVSSKLVGYRYLMLAIRRAVQDPPANLSAAVAEETGKSLSSVERAMKNAIDHTWLHADADALKNYTARIYPGKKTPTISEFVRYYAGKLRLEYD